MDCDKEYKIELLSADGKYEYYVTLSKKRIEHENKTVEKNHCFSKILHIINAALNESYGYLLLAIYALVFLLLSIIPGTQSLLSFYFAVLSFPVFIIDECWKYHTIRSDNSHNFMLTIGFVVALALTILIYVFFPLECINVISTFLGGLLSLITCMIPIINAFKHAYKQYQDKT